MMPRKLQIPTPQSFRLLNRGLRIKSVPALHPLAYRNLDLILHDLPQIRTVDSEREELVLPEIDAVFQTRFREASFTFRFQELGFIEAFNSVLKDTKAGRAPFSRYVL